MTRHNLKCNSPRKSWISGKKKVVLGCANGKQKTIHYGATGYGHNYSPAARRSFRARHRCDSANDKLTARYWACKDLWTRGGESQKCPPNRRCKYSKRKSSRRSPRRRRSKSRRKSRRRRSKSRRKSRRRRSKSMRRRSKSRHKSMRRRSKSRSRRSKSRRKSRRRRSKSRRRRSKSRHKSRRRRSKSRGLKRVRFSMGEKTYILYVHPVIGKGCSACSGAAQYMDKKNIKYIEKTDPNFMPSHKTWPKIVDPDGNFIGGFSDLKSKI